MHIIDRTPVITVGQMPFAAGYINQRASMRLHRKQRRKRALQKLASKLGFRADLRDKQI